MATLPNLYNRTYFLRQALAQTAMPTSVVFPVASATIYDGAFTTVIAMDHERLPPMQSFTIGSDTVNAHNMGDEFMYVCANQLDYSASFHLINDSGLFSLGFSALDISPSVPEFTVVIMRSDGAPSSMFTLRGTEQRLVFLAKGDFFKIACTLPEEAGTHTINGMASNFVATRLSKNVGYTHPSPLLLGSPN